VSGDGAQFDEFVVGRGPALLRFGYLLSGDRGLAEDLVQDALVKLHRRWSGRVVVERPEAYVRRIMLNDFTSWHRRRASTEVIGPVPERISADVMDALAERDAMWRLLRGLSPRQRAVIVLRYYEHEPDTRIAALLGCGESTVRSLAARAFAVLRSHPELAAHTLNHHEETT
jgi:RNA polymerase sigma-70 factor (sigma-E family)